MYLTGGALMNSHGHVTALSHPVHQTQKAPVAATLGALGVVFGGIGTSPLYTLKPTAVA